MSRVREDRGRHRLAADGLVAVELAGVVVERRQAAGGVLALEHALGAVVAQPDDVAVVGDLPGAPAGQLAEGRGVGQRRLAVRAADGHRLEVLGAHHRAHAGAAVGAVAHVDDRGEADQLLARRPDRGDLDPRVSQLGPERVDGLRRRLAPQVTGRAQLGLAVVDPQVDRLGGAATDDDPGEPGEAQLGGEETAALAVADAVRQRGAGVDRDPALPRDRCSGQEAVHPGHDVGRVQPVGPRLHPLEDVVEPHRGAAEVGPVEGLGRGFDLHHPRRQVHMKDPPRELARHGLPLRVVSVGSPWCQHSHSNEPGSSGGASFGAGVARAAISTRASGSGPMALVSRPGCA